MAARPLPRRLAGSYAVAALVLLLLLMALFWRLWTPIDGARRTFGWDAQWQYWGDLQFQYDAYAAGDLPLWNPHDRGGYPYHTDPQVGIFYPVTWLLLGGAAIAGEVDYWWIAIKVVLHFWLACFGTWVFLRRRGVHPAACYVGAAVFILSYPYLHNVFSALNWSMAWTPWVLAALDAWTGRPSRARAALLALAGSMCLLAGAPASFWYSLLVIVPYAVWAVWSGARRAGPAGSAERRAYLRAIAVTGATAAGLGLAMVAVQLRATASVISETVRDQRDLAFITESTYGVDDIAALLIPRMLGGNTYLGAGAIIWAAVALAVYPSSRRIVLGLIAVVGFACALGKHADFLAVGASAIEPFGMFRRAHRYLYVTQLPIAILAAEGLHHLLREERAELRRKITRGVLLWGALGVLVFGIGFAVNQKPNLDAQPLRDAFVLACLCTALAVWITVMITTRSGAWKTTFAWLAVAFVVADLWFARGSDVEKRMHALPATDRDAEVLALGGVPLEARIYDREWAKFRPGTRLGVRDFGGYEDDPLALERYHLLLDRVRKAPRHAAHANVGWYLEAHRRPLKQSPADREALTAMSKGLHQIEQFAPAVMWIDRADIVEGGPKEAVAELLKHAPGTRAVLERSTLPGDVATAARAGEEGRPAVAGRLVELGRNHLVAEIEAPDEGLVVIHETYFPGWRATVDGEERAIVPANGMFRGLLVGPGKHRIEMEYRAPGWALLGVVSVLGFLGALALAVFGLRRERQTVAARQS